MSKTDIIPVILCGGSGTRLWPLSRKSFPKQFVPLIDNKSLLQLTLERVTQLGGSHAASKVVCVAAEEHRFLVAEALQAAKASGRIILEPVARNTTAAMALASLAAKPQEFLLFCPADHHIPDAKAFADMVELGRSAAEADAIVTFGVVPSFPSTAYGYIEYRLNCAELSPQCTEVDKIAEPVHYKVVRFIEKPCTEIAQALILKGSVLWNAGIFLSKAETLLNALQVFAPDILKSCQQAMGAATHDKLFIRPEINAFTTCRSESIDYSVMERHTNVAVIPFSGAWSDVGSWNAVAELIEPDASGNRIDGQGLAVQSSHTYIHAPHRSVVALGTKDLFIIDTPDALLVAAHTHAEHVKHVVAELESLQSPQAALHRKVARPWGWYDTIDVGERFQVKRIAVKPGATLSLQKHHHRAEHWIVVKGTALITRGDDEILLTENQSTYIPLGIKHRLGNPGKTDLEIIEVQSGSYLGEDDIVRFEDSYGRN